MCLLILVMLFTCLFVVFCFGVILMRDLPNWAVFLLALKAAGIECSNCLTVRVTSLQMGVLYKSSTNNIYPHTRPKGLSIDRHIRYSVSNESS